MLLLRGSKQRTMAGLVRGVEQRQPFTEGELVLLSENQIAQSWNRLFQDGTFDEEAFVHAEALLEVLRPESPLLHRLTSELEELRTIHAHRIEA